jgi:urease accessory protein UreH
MPDAGAVSRVRLRAEEGSRLVWGPLTTILHRDSDYVSEIEVVLAGGVVVVAETVVMGRLASGEAFAFRLYEPSLVVRDRERRVLFAERAALGPGQTMRDAMGGRGALSTVYALGVLVDDAKAERLTCVTQGFDLAGWSTLPNGAGVVGKALVGSGSEGEAFARVFIRAMG